MQAQAPEVMEDPKTPEDTDAPKIGALVQQLIMMASMLKELETQSHLIHANAEGSNFLALHEFLKKQYEQHLEQFDHVLELVRTLNHFAPVCSRCLANALPDFVHATTYETRSMLIAYFQNLENMGEVAKVVGESAREAKAPDVDNYMAELCGDAYKASWMIKATLRGC
jgi:DNA-binding ferritin-like protein